MEYMLAILGLVVLCGCAFGAYAELDAIEREDEGRATERLRALRAYGATSAPRSAATLRPTVQLAHPEPSQEHRQHGASVSAYTDWLDRRIRDLEEQLDQLEAARYRAVVVNLTLPRTSVPSPGLL